MQTLEPSELKIDFNLPSGSERIFKTKDRIYSRRLALAKSVQKRKNILFGTAGDDHGPSNAYRRQGWEDVRMELLEKGFVEYEGKTRQDIQKTDWQHVRRYVMDRRKRDAPTRDEPITELDAVVFDVVRSFGRNCLSKDGDMIPESEGGDFGGDSAQGTAYVSTGNPLAAISPPDEEMENEAESKDRIENLPPLSQLIGQIQQNAEDQTDRIAELRMQREIYLTNQERVRLDIENERLIQERIRTQLLFAQLARENPEAAERYQIPQN